MFDDDLLGLMRREFERFFAERYSQRMATISSYDPKNHRAKAKIQPEGQETGWFNLNALHIGNGWGVVVGPQVDDQVLLGFMENDFEKPHLVGRYHSDQEKPPTAQSGEIVFQHEKAGTIKFDKDQNITWTGANGQVFSTDKKGNMSMSMKVSNAKNSDNNSPSLTINVTDQNNKSHSMTFSNAGIACSSDVSLTVKAPKIKHNGDLEVTGSVYATKTLQSAVGLLAPMINTGIASGTVPPADNT